MSKENNNTFNYVIGSAKGANNANKQNGQEQYINLNCYRQDMDENGTIVSEPKWLFRVSCVEHNKKATVNVLEKIVKPAYAEKGILFTYIEGNLRKEQEEEAELF
jgi:hypothetical protein